MDDTPEGKLLLGMQGLIADYERTKIAERTRRGKLYWARQGAHVGGHAPYGYHFVRRSDEARAHLVVDEEKAPVVRRMYRMLVDEQLSMRAIAIRLTADEVLTAHGARQWQPTAVDRMLRNPVYRGVHYYQRTQAVAPKRRRTTDPYKQHRKTGQKPRPPEEWIPIPVPPIVTEAVWEAAQAQLVQNSLHSRRNNKRRQYLLRGLIRCPRCGSAYIGYGRKDYRGYRCIGAVPESSSTGHRCPPGGIPAGPVEEAVWAAVTEAFQHPDLLLTEYERRLAESSSAGAVGAEQSQITVALKRTAAQEDRVTQAYLSEAMDLARYKAEMEKLKQRRSELDHAAKDIERRARQELDARDALAHLQRFCDQVCRGLEAMTFDQRQQFLRLVVERVTVEDGTVRVDTIIPIDGPADRDVGRLRTRRAELVEVRASARRSANSTRGKPWAHAVRP